MSSSEQIMVRYDELIQLLSDCGFHKQGDSYPFEIWLNQNDDEFQISPDKLFIPLVVVEHALKKANISPEQLEFYKQKFYT